MADEEKGDSGREGRGPHGFTVIEGNLGIRRRKNRLPQRRVRARVSERRAREKVESAATSRLPRERRRRSTRRRAKRKLACPPMRQSMRELKNSMLRAKPEVVLGALEDLTSELRSLCPDLLGTDPNG
jgi:hypothetical protein